MFAIDKILARTQSSRALEVVVVFVVVVVVVFVVVVVVVVVFVVVVGVVEQPLGLGDAVSRIDIWPLWDMSTNAKKKHKKKTLERIQSAHPTPLY